MVVDDRIQSLAQELAAGRLNRRDFFHRAAMLGLSASAVAVAITSSPTDAVAQDMPEIAREKTLIAVRGGTQGKFIEDQIWNPFLPTGNHQLGSQLLYEPLAFYSAFTDSYSMWLAESYEYSTDYMELTVKTRPNISWSDGTPFSSGDVAYTFNKLVEVGSVVKFGADVQQFLASA